MMVKNDKLLLFYYEETCCAVKAFVIIHVFVFCPRGTVYMQLMYPYFSFEFVFSVFPNYHVQRSPQVNVKIYFYSKERCVQM